MYDIINTECRTWPRAFYPCLDWPVANLRIFWSPIHFEIEIFWCLPSGKRWQKTMENHHALNGKIMEHQRHFDAIFKFANSVQVYQAGYSMIFRRVIQVLPDATESSEFATDPPEVVTPPPESPEARGREEYHSAITHDGSMVLVYMLT